METFQLNRRKGKMKKRTKIIKKVTQKQKNTVVVTVQCKVMCLVQVLSVKIVVI